MVKPHIYKDPLSKKMDGWLGKHPKFHTWLCLTIIAMSVFGPIIVVGITNYTGDP